MCENLCMSKAEYIRSLIEDTPKGALVRAAEISEKLACHVGCGTAEANNTTRQVLMAMEHDGQIARAFRGIYVKTCGDSLDMENEQTRLEIADLIYVAGGSVGYYRGKRALEIYGLGRLSQDPVIVMASNESAGRQPALARRLGVVIEKPTAAVDSENSKYLHALDMISANVESLMELDDAEIKRLFSQFEREDVDYRKLVGFASKYGSVRTVRAVARLCERLL